MNFKFVIKKIITSFITLLFLATVTFFVFEIIPGDVVTAKLGTEATEEMKEAFREHYGLNESIIERFVDFISGLFTGDLGLSYATDLPVTEMMSEYLPVTIGLAVISLVIIIIISLPVGLFVGAMSSKKKNVKKTIAFEIVNQTFMSVPPFLIGMFISLFFGLTLNLFVPGQYISIDESFGGFILCLIPAAIAVAIPKIAMMVRFIKNSVADEMQADYVRTAKSKGLSDGKVLWKHVLKNVLITNVTALSVVVVEIFAGSVVVEQVFSLPGLGRLLVSSVGIRDFKVVSVIVMYIGIVVITANLISDIVYAAVDKRTIGGDHE